MGHADIKRTLNSYTDFEEERALKAVGRVDRLLWSVAPP
jgi:hypothetical protein